MDYVEGANAVTMATSSSGGSLLEYVVGFGVAMAVLRLEVMRRAADLPRFDGRHPIGGYSDTCKKILRLYAPEATGLVACLALAATLRISYSTHAVVDEQTWNDIMARWPILLTADTLLSLQAMLRLLVFTSNVFRTGGSSTPLSKEAAALSCGAVLGRVLLVARGSSYMLDGPVGGYLPVACELLSVPLLAVLSRGISRRALAFVMLMLALCLRIAHRNRLGLATDPLSDSLFVFAHIAELFAAFAYLCQAVLIETGCIGTGQKQVALRFSHVVMPVQQCLAAYYFVQAFEAEPALVTVGHPFEILQVGGVAQLGAYAAAAVLHLAEYVECPSEEAAQEAHVEAIDDATHIPMLSE